jgi:hypothetical protein
MDEHEFNAEPNTSGKIEVTRRTVIETGTAALLLTTLPRAALAAGLVDDNETSPPVVDVKLQVHGHSHFSAHARRRPDRCSEPARRHANLHLASLRSCRAAGG